MALPSSGAISLQDIEDEFGGTGSISISEYYGAASGVPSSGTIDFDDFHGKSSSLDTQTVTVGYYVNLFEPYNVFYGYANGLMGSISDGTFNVKSGANIGGLYWDDTYQYLYFLISGSHANSGWTTMKVGSTTFNRTSASFNNSSSTTWQWNSVSSSPFSAPDTNTTVVFN